MPIIDFTPPSSARAPRLTAGEVATLAEKVRAGKWASDGIATSTRSCAYQRAQTALKLLFERHGLDNLKTHSSPVDAAITPLETQMIKVAKKMKTTQVEDELTDLQAQRDSLAQQIAELGGYHWAVGPAV